MFRLSILAALFLLVSASCDSSHSSTGPFPPPIAPQPTAPVGPSSRVQIICGEQAVRDAALTFGMKTVRPVRPTWRRGIYACDFVYEHGATAGVSARELASVASATAYYDRLATRLGKTRAVLVGEEAFATANGSFVVRVRNTVLVVDVSRLPVDFASRNGRADFAQTLAEIIVNESDPM